MINYNFVKMNEGYKDYEEKRRKRREEVLLERAEEERKRDKKIQAYVYPYDHPIPEHARVKIAKIELVRSKRNEHNKTHPQWNRWGQSKEQYEFLEGTLSPEHVQSVYIISKDLEIIDWVESKNDVGYWVFRNGYRNKALGRSTVYEYIKNRWMYKDQFYFVPVKEYEEFIESKKN